MEFKKEIDLTKKPAKSLLKDTSNKDKKPKKKNIVVWDTKNLEENAEYLRLHPPTMRIEEPKTPYDPYEQGDDSYLEKVRQMFNVKPTEDVLNDVSKELMKHFDSKGNKKEDDDEFVEIELFEDGQLVKKKVSKNHKDNIEFLKKRRVAYGNEYTNARKMMESEKEENNENNNNNSTKKRELTEEELKEIELDDQTVKNTIINKFSSMVFKRQKEEELRKLNEKKNDGNDKKEENNNDKVKKKEKKEKKKIVFMEKTEEIPNIEFPGEKEMNKEENDKNNEN
jgi:hypothetical protein